jgi:hypothetical protein
MRNSGAAFKVAMVAKSALASMRETQDRIRSERKAEADEARQRKLDKAKRRAEGEMRAAQVQNIGADKVKKMNKRQLKQVKKTRLNAQTGVVEFVGAYQ